MVSLHFTGWFTCHLHNKYTVCLPFGSLYKAGTAVTKAQACATSAERGLMQASTVWIATQKSTKNATRMGCASHTAREPTVSTYVTQAKHRTSTGYALDRSDGVIHAHRHAVARLEQRYWHAVIASRITEAAGNHCPMRTPRYTMHTTSDVYV